MTCLNKHDLKCEVLTLVGYLGQGESLTAIDGASTVDELVTRACADRNTTPIMMALLASLLARYIDEQAP